MSNAITRSSERLSAVELTGTRLKDSWKTRLQKSFEWTLVSRFIRERPAAIREYWRGQGASDMAEAIKTRVVDRILCERDEEEKAFTKERQHTAQAFTHHVEWKDGRHTEGLRNHSRRG